MKRSIAALAAIPFAMMMTPAAHAAEPTCAELLGKSETEAKSYEEAEKKERSKAMARAQKDPMLLIMEDGRIVDLGGEEPLSKPLESWTNAQDRSIRAREAIKRAKEAAANNDEEGCSREIRSFRWNRV